MKQPLDHLSLSAPTSTSASGSWFIWAFAIATVILVVVGVLAYVSLGRAADAFALRGHTRDVLSSLAGS